MSLGDRIKRAREERGWSQAELARRAEVRPATLCELETGKLEDTKVSTLKKIAKVLRVSVDYLIDMRYDRRSPAEQPSLCGLTTLPVTITPEGVTANAEYTTVCPGTPAL